MTTEVQQAALAEQPVESPASRGGLIRWGEVVQYVDGWAWGIDATGKTICLGRAPAVKEAIAKGGSTGNPGVDAIIQLERELQGIIERGKDDGRPTDNQLRHRTSEIRRRGNIGARPMRPARRQRPDGR